MSRFVIAVALIACGVAACGSSPSGETDAAPDTFLAFNPAFAPFRTWTSFHSDGPVDDGTFSADVLGPRTQYINTPPAHGATEFPVGTIIVESRENASHKIFAGVKRGGGFNSTGALDWEWFELTEDPTVTPAVQIAWRGFGPPSGEMYGGDPNGGCNSCHMKCGATNDYVCSAKLQLPSF
jgi:hypothetical protein